MGDTKISWTNKTWSPVRGCSRVSAGCQNCYAERQAHRFSGRGQPYEGLTTLRGGRPGWTGEVRFIPDMLDAPLHWRKPRRVFVNSMSDLFHERVTNEQIAAVFGVMAACPQHTFQVLTKRPERMREWFDWVARAGCDGYSGRGDTPAEHCRGCALDAREWRAPDGSMPPGPGRSLLGYDTRWPLPNVWLGVSVEDQRSADERIPHLIEVPAAVRFVSAEPLLEVVDLTHIDADRDGHRTFCQVDTLAGRHTDMGRPCRDVPRIDWVIAGGESGPRARPFRLDWARSLRDQCKAAGVSFFFKQTGSVVEEDTSTYKPLGVGADMAEWPPDIRIREFPVVADCSDGSGEEPF